MTYASILVHVDWSDASDGRVRLAAGLAERFQGRLLGLGCFSLVPAVPEVPGISATTRRMYQDEEDSLAASARKLEQRFRQIVSRTGIDAEWQTSFDEPSAAILNLARRADLIVLGRDRLRRRTEVLLRGGKPLLVVPQGSSELLAKNIVVGWNDSREARRAVSDSLPFLTSAASVHMIEILHHPLSHPLGTVHEAVRYLSAHAVHAHAETRLRDELSDADQLLLFAEQHSADLIIAGAYGHSQFRNWVLGGVTNVLLARSPKCCLLSH